MLRFRSTVIFFCVLLFSGCATVTPQQKAQLELEASRPITCTQGQDCEEKWGRALIWVQDNSKWKLRIANETIITTEGPFDTTASAFSITKISAGNGKYNIIFRAGCGNMFGCLPSVLEHQASFVSYVMGPMSAPAAVVKNVDGADKPRLGVVMAKTNADAARLLQMNEPRGVIVISVVENSMALRAGLMQGDVILKLGDNTINEATDVQRLVSEIAPGTTIPITIWRAERGEMVVPIVFSE